MKAKELPGALKGGILGERSGLSQGLTVASYMVSEERGKREAGEKALEVMTKEQIEAMVKALLKEGKNKEAELIALAAMKDGKYRPEDIGLKDYNSLDAKEKAEWDENGWKSQTGRLLSNKENIDLAGDGFWRTADAQMAIHDNWGSEEFTATVKKFKGRFVNHFNDGLQTYIKNLQTLDPIKASIEFKALAYSNPKQYLYLDSSAAQKSGLESIFKNASDLVEDKYKKNGEKNGAIDIKKFMADKP